MPFSRAVRTAAMAPPALSYGLPGTTQIASKPLNSDSAASGVAIQ